MEVRISTAKIREVLESSGCAYTAENIAAVRANIPLHTSDLILAALNATDLPISGLLCRCSKFLPSSFFLTSAGRQPIFCYKPNQYFFRRLL